VNFKNALEQHCFEIARETLGRSVQLEHNKRVQIDSALFPEVAAFKGPPSKEVDVLVAELLERPKVMLLVSCKEFAKRAEPAHVQEWAAVVRTLNTYSERTRYLGLILSSNGFTGGCEPWATSHNLGLIPPLKGKNIAFAPDAVLRMFRRSLAALHKRMRLRADDLFTPPAFFNFIYSLISDYEGHEEVAQHGRYYTFPQNWISSFGEMYSALGGHQIQDLIAIENGTTIIRFDGDISCRFAGSRVEFGSGVTSIGRASSAPICVKNLDNERCTLDFIKATVVGLPVTSAGDFGDYIEFGVDQRFNLGMHRDGFHLLSTENPVKAHQL
jgi:hypothetical protein